MEDGFERDGPGLALKGSAVLRDVASEQRYEPDDDDANGPFGKIINANRQANKERSPQKDMLPNNY